jgi:23S rRNA (guanine2445-N2)-methyltransferase / 23S rRNA (guanine2069-N7)-methyltransferase
MELNGFQESPRHRFIQADCLEWLEDQVKDLKSSKYDLIFLDPPTFSNSKRMQRVLDINRDYPELIRWAVRLLDKGGVLIFSTNSRKFRMDTELFKRLKIEDISRATLPQDFERNPRIHYCWRITKSSTTIYLNRNKDEDT